MARPAPKFKFDRTYRSYERGNPESRVWSEDGVSSPIIVDLTLRVRTPHAEREVYYDVGKSL